MYFLSTVYINIDRCLKQSHMINFNFSKNIIDNVDIFTEYVIKCVSSSVHLISQDSGLRPLLNKVQPEEKLSYLQLKLFGHEINE